MEYPEDFSPQARARVEAERLKAGKELEQQRNEVTWSPFGPSTADEENLRKYILRVFLVFAQEACKLGSQRSWTVDRIRSAADEFLRSFTIEAYYDKGHDKSGRELREMVSHWNGSILPKVQREFEKSPEWHQFEQELLAVAEQQTRGSPQSSGKPGPLKLERLQDKRGKKPAQQIIDRDRDMARLAFEGRPPLAIAVYLDDCNYPTPKTWRTPKFAPKGEKYQTGIRVSRLRKSFCELISKAKRKYPIPAPAPN